MSKLKKILFIQYTNPSAYPPLERASQLLAEQGWHVLFLGTGAWGKANEFEFPPHDRIQVRKISFCPPGWRQKLHYFRFLLWNILWVICWRPQWIYASDLRSCPIALVLSFIPRLKIIYHEHDSPSKPSKKIEKFFDWTRTHLSMRTCKNLLPNETRVNRFLEKTKSNRKNVMTIFNCPSLKTVSLPKVSKSEVIWILYQGSLNPARLPFSILEALTFLPPTIKLRIIGYETVGHLSYVKQLKLKAEKLKIQERISIVDAMPYYDSLRSYISASDIGLALMPKQTTDFNEQTMAGASNKAFDYLANGLALLVSDLPEWKKMFVEPGFAYACDPASPNSIAENLKKMIAAPEDMRKMGERGRQKIIKEWNYEKQFSPVFNTLVSSATPSFSRKRENVVRGAG